MIALMGIIDTVIRPVFQLDLLQYWRTIVMATVKEELANLIRQQPADSSAEEVVRELAFHVMVQRGLADSDAGRVISNEDMARRIRAWRK